MLPTFNRIRSHHTGWIHIHGVQTAYTNYYKKMKPGEAEVWPPKYWKFQIETDGPSPVKMAYTDPRRFGRVRLVDCPGKDIRSFSPLVENGPDPDVDRAIFTQEFFTTKVKNRRVPIKALLLDQAFISGIGNWVGDEILYHAQVHPEQYSDTFSDEQLKKLYDAVCYVCRTAIEKLGDSDQFPDDWLFHYRWGKGSSKAPTKLPSGEKLAFVTVGGRTSCFIPSLQKKTGAVAPGAKEEPVDSKDPIDPEEAKPSKSGKKAVKPATSKTPGGGKRKRSNSDVDAEADAAIAKAPEAAKAQPKKKAAAPAETEPSGNRRRSRRLEGK